MKADLLASELINNPAKEPDNLYKQYHSLSQSLHLVDPDQQTCSTTH